GGKETLPDAGFAPALKAAVDRGPRAVALGQVPPWRTGAQNPQDAVQDAAMVCRRSSCMGSLRRQQRLESCPLFIREFMSVSHAFTVSTLSSLHTHPRQGMSKFCAAGSGESTITGVKRSEYSRSKRAP